MTNIEKYWVFLGIAIALIPNNDFADKMDAVLGGIYTFVALIYFFRSIKSSAENSQ